MAELKVLKVGDVIKFAKEAVYTDAAKNESVIPAGTELKVISIDEAVIELECKLGEKVQSVILDSKDPNLSGDAMSKAPEKETPVKQDTGALKVDNGPTDKDPNLSKDNAAKAAEKPGEVKQGAGSLDKDKNGGSAADPTLNKDNVAKAPEKAAAPGKQGDSSINKDDGPTGKDANLGKDNVKKIGDIKLRDSVDPNLSKENTHQEAGSQAPVNQNKAALDVDKNKGKEADPNLNKDDVKKVGEGKLPASPEGEVDQKYINDLLEKHGLQETDEEKAKREKAAKEAKDKKEADEKAEKEKKEAKEKAEKAAKEKKEKDESIQFEVKGLTAVPHVAVPESQAGESTEVIESMRKESEGMILQEGIGLAPKKDGAKGDTPQARIEALIAELAAEDDETAKKDAADMKKVLALLVAKKDKEFEKALHGLDTSVRDTFIDYYDNFGKDKAALKVIRAALPGWEIGEAADDMADVEKTITGVR